jgi:hypothetical protein
MHSCTAHAQEHAARSAGPCWQPPLIAAAVGAPLVGWRGQQHGQPLAQLTFLLWGEWDALGGRGGGWAHGGCRAAGHEGGGVRGGIGGVRVDDGATCVYVR